MCTDFINIESCNLMIVSFFYIVGGISKTRV